MADVKLTEPEYLMLRLLAEMNGPFECGGDMIASLHRRAFVDQSGAGWLITELGRSRAAEPL